jgi:hypothetical protein
MWGLREGKRLGKGELTGIVRMRKGVLKGDGGR